MKTRYLSGIDGALDDGFAQAPGGADDGDAGKAGVSVSMENITPGGAEVGAHHPLHADRERDLQVVEALDLAVADGPVGEQGGVAAAAGVQELPLARDVQEGLLLPGEARVRAGPRRWRCCAPPRRAGPCRPAPPVPVVGADGVGDIAGELAVQEQLPDGVSGGAQGGVPGPVGGNARSHGGVDPVGRDERAVRGGGGGEAVRHPHALGFEGPDELAERGVLAAHLRDIGHADLVKPHHGGFSHHSTPVRCRWTHTARDRYSGVRGFGPARPLRATVPPPGPPPSKSPDTCGIAGTIPAMSRGSGELEGAGSRGVGGAGSRASGELAARGRRHVR